MATSRLGGLVSEASTDSDSDIKEVPAPRWVAASLDVRPGLDPLGLQTMTQDRLTPILLPGVLELTRRARYLSFHAFLLLEYRERRLPTDKNALSVFIKRCEWDLGLAVLRCPNHCGSSPVGIDAIGNLAAGPGPFRRGESVKSYMGAYGLYYRSPLAALGIAAKAGTLLGEQPIPIDVLYDSDRALQLAKAFRSAVKDTDYYQKWMWLDAELPAEVVDEYAEVACLCRLRELPDERDAVRRSLFSQDPTEGQLGDTGEEQLESDEESAEVSFSEENVKQRQRSFGHFLSMLEANPLVVSSESAWREGLWSPPPPRSQEHAFVADEWSALIAKDIWQEAICSVWSEFCRTGLSLTRELGRDLTRDEAKQMVENMVGGPPTLESDMSTKQLDVLLSKGELSVLGLENSAVQVVSASLESLRTWTVELDTATSGLVLLLELARRTGEHSGPGWDLALHLESAWQPSVAAVLTGLKAHLAKDPSVGETLWWLVWHFVLTIHERICYSKLPEFTFRFRWEDGLLHFYDLGIGRFPLAAIRNQPLTSLTRDLAMWEEVDGTPQLTELGASFVDEVLG